MSDAPAVLAPDVVPESVSPPQVLRQFRVVFGAVRSHFRQVEKQAGIGGAQAWALSLVQRQPGLGVTELAQAMDIHQSTASNLVRQLLQRGLLRSEKSPQDRRSVHLYLEPAGVAVLQTLPGPFEGVLPQALQQLSPEALAQLHAGLAQLLPLLQADLAAGGVPLAEL